MNGPAHSKARHDRSAASPSPGERTPAPARTHGEGGASDLRALQQSAGNRAVARMLAAGRGRPLEPAVRTEMESSLGHDFGDVRVHDGPEAAATARGLGAKALTVGTDLAFAAGRFAPGTAEGRRLLAHELAHVVQQRRGGPPPAPEGQPSLEGPADSAASAVAAGGQVASVGGASGVGIACDPVDDLPAKKPRRPPGFNSDRHPPGRKVAPGTMPDLKYTRSDAMPAPRQTEVTREEQLYGIPSRQDRAALRSATPTQAIRDDAQAQLPPGSDHPVFPGTTDEPVAADHIIPANEIRKMPGFAALNDQDQRAVLNSPENFQPMPERANSIKQDKNNDEFRAYLEREGIPYRPEYFEDIASREAALRQLIQERINARLAAQYELRAGEVPGTDPRASARIGGDPIELQADPTSRAATGTMASPEASASDPSAAVAEPATVAPGTGGDAPRLRVVEAGGETFVVDQDGVPADRVRVDPGRIRVAAQADEGADSHHADELTPEVDRPAPGRLKARRLTSPEPVNIEAGSQTRGAGVTPTSAPAAQPRLNPGTQSTPVATTETTATVEKPAVPPVQTRPAPSTPAPETPAATTTGVAPTTTVPETSPQPGRAPEGAGGVGRPSVPGGLLRAGMGAVAAYGAYQDYKARLKREGSAAAAAIPPAVGLAASFVPHDLSVTGQRLGAKPGGAGGWVDVAINLANLGVSQAAEHGLIKGDSGRAITDVSATVAAGTGSSAQAAILTTGAESYMNLYRASTGNPKAVDNQVHSMIEGNNGPLMQLAAMGTEFTTDLAIGKSPGQAFEHATKPGEHAPWAEVGSWSGDMFFQDVNLASRVTADVIHGKNLAVAVEDAEEDNKLKYHTHAVSDLAVIRGRDQVIKAVGREAPKLAAAAKETVKSFRDAGAAKANQVKEVAKAVASRVEEAPAQIRAAAKEKGQALKAAGAVVLGQVKDEAEAVTRRAEGAPAEIKAAVVGMAAKSVQHAEEFKEGLEAEAKQARTVVDRYLPPFLKR